VRPFDAGAIATGAMLARRSPWRDWVATPKGRRALVMLLVALLAAVALGVALTAGSRHVTVPTETTLPTQLNSPNVPSESAVPTLAAPPAFRGVIETTIDLPSDVLGQLVELPDGRILVAGGGSHSAVLDLHAGTVDRLPGGPQDGAIALHDGRLFNAAAHGFEGSTTWVEVFDPSTNQTTRLDDVPIVGPGADAGCCDLWAPAVAVLRDGRVLVAGGHYQGPDTAIASAAIFDPATDRFQLLDARMPTPIVGPTSIVGGTATTLPDGRVLILGGTSTKGSATRALLFDPTMSSFTDLGSVPGIQDGAIAVRLTDDRVLVAESELGSGFSDDEPGRAAIFDPTTDTFSKLPDLPHRPYRAIALRDGRVLMVNGWVSTVDAKGKPLKTPVGGARIFIYDAATATVEDLPDIPTVESSVPLVVGGPIQLADGRVLLVVNRGGSSAWNSQFVVYN